MEPFHFLEPEGLLEHIRTLIRCPFCFADYDESDISIIARFEQNYVAHLSCRMCDSGIMASFSYRFEGQKRRSDTKHLDVKIPEMMKFAEKGTISDQEVVELYRGLKSFDGNFKKVFRSKVTRKK